MVLRTAPAFSRRLRSRLEPVAFAYGEPGKRLLGDKDAKQLYPRYRIVGYHATIVMDKLMKTALSRARELASTDPIAPDLAAYLDRHLIEEMHHDEPGGLDLEDLAVLGVDPDTVRSSPPPPQISDLLSSLKGRINREHPVAVLGFLQLENFHPTVKNVEKLIAITGLPPDGFRNLELHAHLDVGHAEEIDRQLDTLPLGRWHEKLIYRSAVSSIKAVRAALLDVVKGRA